MTDGAKLYPHQPHEPVLNDPFDQSDGRFPEPLYREPRWYACYTRGRHEKTADEQLRQRGIESYLPMVPRESQWKDRRKRVLWPLFPSYLFGFFTLQDLTRVLSTHGIATVVAVRGRPLPIPTDEIESVRRLSHAIAAGEIDAEPGPFAEVGDWVRVDDGPFSGVTGVVVRRAGKRRVLVGISAINQGFEIDLPTASLTSIRPPA